MPEAEYLRLYDRTGQRRLTQAEAEAQARWAEVQARQAETKRAEALAEKLRSLGIDPNQI